MSLSASSISLWAWRIVLAILFQVLLLKDLHIPGDPSRYAQVILYPVCVLFLPANTSRPLLLLLAFVVGIIVDMFYDSPGVHAGALVAVAYIRPIVIGLLEPRLGIKIGQESAAYSYGFSWLFLYSTLLLLLFSFIYFILQIFTAVYFAEIILHAIFSFLVSIVAWSIFILILRPKI